MPRIIVVSGGQKLVVFTRPVGHWNAAAAAIAMVNGGNDVSPLGEGCAKYGILLSGPREPVGKYDEALFFRIVR